MDISNYFNKDGQAVYFDESQASKFAKGVAGDFNPLHDIGSKRFCVPGDLLFSVLLHLYGVTARTRVEFCGMLDGNTRMLLPDEAREVMHVTDARERSLLNLNQSGTRITNTDFISELCHQYVKFSGQTFPNILVPLMEKAGAMINPQRPMVIYKDMAIEFDDEAVQALFEGQTDGTLTTLKAPLEGSLSLSLSGSDIEVNGRKGAVNLRFDIMVADQLIGTGVKNMLLSGLRDYEAEQMQAVVDTYHEWRAHYQSS